MIVAALADFAETSDDDLRGALALLQQQIKYGLNSTAAIGFFEAGFADRVVAMELAKPLSGNSEPFRGKNHGKTRSRCGQSCACTVPELF